MWKTVLLDIDGTLLDSNTGHAAAWVDAFAQYGRIVPFDKIMPLIGKGGDKVLDELAPGLIESEGDGKHIVEARREIFLNRYLPGIGPTNGARALVERIRDSGMKPVVATSATGAELEALLKAANVADLMDEHATSDDAEGSKPEPDIIHAALDKAGSSAEETIMVGDTPWDIEAAQRANVTVIALRSGGHDAALSGARAVYDDPADLVRHWVESPLGET